MEANTKRIDVGPADAVDMKRYLLVRQAFKALMSATDLSPAQLLQSAKKFAAEHKEDITVTIVEHRNS